MLRLQKINLRRIYGECTDSFFKMNSCMEDTSQIFLCKSGSRRRPASARDRDFTKNDYETQVLNMVDEIVQDSQRKGNRHPTMLQQPTVFSQERSRTWTAAMQGDKTSSDIRERLARQVRSFEGINGRASTKHCSTGTTTEKCVCGRTDRIPREFFASQRTSISPKRGRSGWEDVRSSLSERVFRGKSRSSSPSSGQKSPRSDPEFPVSHVHSSPPTRFHRARHAVLSTCCSTPPPQRQVRHSSPPSYAALLTAIASASPLRTRPRSRPQSRAQSAARRPSSRSRTRGSPDSCLSFAAMQSPPPFQRSFYSRSVHLQEGSTSYTSPSQN